MLHLDTKINDANISEYKERFNLISRDRGVSWVSKLFADQVYLYHEVEVRGDRECVYASIRIDPIQMYQIGAGALSEYNFRYFVKRVGSVICSKLPKQFTPFIVPRGAL